MLNLVIDCPYLMDAASPAFQEMNVTDEEISTREAATIADLTDPSNHHFGVFNVNILLNNFFLYMPHPPDTRTGWKRDCFSAEEWETPFSGH